MEIIPKSRADREQLVRHMRLLSFTSLPKTCVIQSAIVLHASVGSSLAFCGAKKTKPSCLNMNKTSGSILGSQHQTHLKQERVIIMNYCLFAVDYCVLLTLHSLRVLHGIAVTFKCQSVLQQLVKCIY